VERGTVTVDTIHRGLSPAKHTVTEQIKQYWMISRALHMPPTPDSW